MPLLKPVLKQPSPLKPALVLKTPPRYKTCFLSWIVVSCVSTPIGLLLSPVRAHTPQTIHDPIKSAATIALLNYFLMPLITQTPLCRRWLHPNRSNRFKL